MSDLPDLEDAVTGEVDASEGSPPGASRETADSGAAAAQSGTDEKEKSAVEASNYYFFKSTPAHLAAQYKPQLLATGAAAAAAASNSNASASAGPSVWNTAGTWEEKDFSVWARERMDSLFIGIGPEDLDDGSAMVTRTDKVTGEASVVWARGKKKANFELSVTLVWEGTYKGAKATGKIMLPDLDVMNLDDFEVEVTADATDSAHAALRTALRSDDVADEFRRRVADFCKELCARD